jgi:hypothetical protein
VRQHPAQLLEVVHALRRLAQCPHIRDRGPVEAAACSASSVARARAASVRLAARLSAARQRPVVVVCGIPVIFHRLYDNSGSIGAAWDCHGN